MVLKLKGFQVRSTDHGIKVLRSIRTLRPEVSEWRLDTNVDWRCSWSSTKSSPLWYLVYQPRLGPVTRRSLSLAPVYNFCDLGRTVRTSG
ncbi:uncharacterized protein N7483_010212 [Penicillium malachiteum]|uniref:uncharacterized protein n=1 Tax=Penicillium malachiteum TaxID=1324776 RepID=UPI002549AC43|nr:uncharacterized protein N7483_010212 [Penicillium malachiteum]KAJ5713031.1 hypothetical protein N7483_010212 [Penicillium malachiteum]